MMKLSSSAEPDVEGGHTNLLQYYLFVTINRKSFLEHKLQINDVAEKHYRDADSWRSSTGTGFSLDEH